MNTISSLLDFFSPTTWQVAAWTMVHFLWVGTLIGIATVLIRLLLRNASANFRYAAMLLSLGALACAPVGIACWLLQSETLTDFSAKKSVVSNNDTLAEGQPQLSLGQRSRFENHNHNLAEGHIQSLSDHTESFDASSQPQAQVSGESPAALEPAPLTTSGPNVTDTYASTSTETKLPETSAFGSFHAVIEQLPWVWLIGTPLVFAWLALGLTGGERLRRGATIIQNGPLFYACERLAQELHIRGRVALATCERVASPVLVGIVRPMILVPPAALTGWSPEEIEMVLLHELAHVRRWDNLVNLAQRIVEACLFFHPVVWLVSGWVRQEREACCDAVVIGHTAKPQAYAELLVNLATSQTPVVSVAMARHPLSRRVRTILKLEDPPMLVSRNTVGLLVFSVLAVVNVLLWVPSTQSVAQESGTQLPSNPNQFDRAGQRLEEAGKKLEQAGQRLDEAVVGKNETQNPRLPFRRITEPGKTMVQYLPHPISPEKVSEEVRKLNRIGHNVTIRNVKGATILLVEDGILDQPFDGIAPFPTLEEQKMADMAWKMLDLELEKIDDDDLKRVKKLGFQGGLKVVVNSRGGGGEYGGGFGSAGTGIQVGDLLVGLHVWPTKDLNDVGKVLMRPDLTELSPLKFYVVRKQKTSTRGGGRRRSSRRTPQPRRDNSENPHQEEQESTNKSVDSFNRDEDIRDNETEDGEKYGGYGGSYGEGYGGMEGGYGGYGGMEGGYGGERGGYGGMEGGYGGMEGGYGGYGGMEMGGRAPTTKAIDKLITGRIEVKNIRVPVAMPNSNVWYSGPSGVSVNRSQNPATNTTAPRFGQPVDIKIGEPLSPQPIINVPPAPVVPPSSPNPPPRPAKPGELIGPPIDPPSPAQTLHPPSSPFPTSSQNAPQPQSWSQYPPLSQLDSSEPDYEREWIRSLVELQSHEDPKMQLAARRALSNRDNEIVVKQLTSLIKSQEEASTQLAAIRTFAYLGSRTRSAVPVIDKLLRESKDWELLIAAINAKHQLLLSDMRTGPNIAIIQATYNQLKQRDDWKSLSKIKNFDHAALMKEIEKERATVAGNATVAGISDVR